MNESGLPQVPEEKPHEILAGLGLNLSHELVKLVAAASLDPVLTAAADSAGGVIKAMFEYRKARQEKTGLDFLQHVRKMLLRHEQVLEKLKKRECQEPFADVFTTIFNAAINDDESAKAKFYAAFVVAFASRGLTISKQVMLVDAMKRLRAHELYVLLLYSRCIKEVNGLAAMVDFNGKPRFNFGLQPAPGSPTAEFLSFELTGQALGSIAGLGLLVQQSASGSGNIVSNPSLTLHLGPLGSMLSKMILENLDDIKPIVAEAPPGTAPLN